MESRPLQNTFNVVIHGLSSILRWPLDHLVPTYSGIMGSNETILQLCVTFNLIIAIGLLFASYTTKGDKAKYKFITVGIQSNYAFLSILNILTRFPQRFDLLSIARSYLLLLSTFLQILMLIGGNFSQKQKDDPFFAVIHFSFIIDILFLSGLWQFLLRCQVLISMLILYSLLAWIIIGFIIPARGNKKEDESNQRNLSKDDKDKIYQINREILVASIDTIVLLLLQYA